MAITLQTSLELIICGKCGIEFAVPEYWRTKRLQDHHDFYCPNGHGQHFIVETEADKLRKELNQQIQSHDQTLAKLRDAEEQARKLERRLKHGVCPCCRRTFTNLQRHMKTEHPEYGPAPLDVTQKVKRRKARA
jgi:hypothetical protein